MYNSFTITNNHRDKLKEPKTSTSHPINISWIVPPDIQSYLSNHPLPEDFELYDCIRPTLKEKLEQISNRHSISPLRGNLCLSSCPGKKVRLSGPVKGRATINRDLDLDFLRMKSFGITLIVCCLDDYEMEFLGAPWPKYIAAATDKNIKIYRLPMVEGSCPNTIEDVKNAIDVVNDEIVQGNNVLVHCRGGIRHK